MYSNQDVLLNMYRLTFSLRMSRGPYPARQRFLALSSRWETRGTSARNRTISYRACANYVSICHAKRHFLSLKVNVTSSYFAGTAYDNFGAKNFTMSATPVSSANVSPKTPTKAHRLSVSKCCLICNVNLTANSSFYRTTYAGLSEKLEKLLRTSIEPRDRKYALLTSKFWELLNSEFFPLKKRPEVSIISLLKLGRNAYFKKKK